MPKNSEFKSTDFLTTRSFSNYSRFVRYWVPISATIVIIFFSVPFLHWISSAAANTVEAGMLARPEWKAGQDDSLLVETSDCTPDFTQSAPEEVHAGELFSITMSFVSACPERRPAVHAVGILDVTVANSRDLDSAKETLGDRIDILLSGNPRARAAVIEVSGSARVACEMSDDASALGACLERIGRRSGQSNSAQGIRKALSTLREARRDLDLGQPVNELFWLYSDLAGESCSTVEREARIAQRDDIRFSATCVTSSTEVCQNECYRDINKMSGFLDREFLDPDGRELRIVDLIVTNTLPANIEFVAGKIRPRLKFESDDKKTLVWEPSMTRSRIDFEFPVRAMEVGLWPASAKPAAAQFDDNEGEVGDLEANIPNIQVLPPLERPTDTPEPPTPTDPSPPTDPPTPTASLVPTDPPDTETPTPEMVDPEELYLPILWLERE